MYYHAALESSLAYSPGLLGASEKPYPGRDGHTTSNTIWLSFWEVVINLGMISRNSTTDPGHPWSSSRGTTLLPCETGGDARRK